MTRTQSRSESRPSKRATRPVHTQGQRRVGSGSYTHGPGTPRRRPGRSRSLHRVGRDDRYLPRRRRVGLASLPSEFGRLGWPGVTSKHWHYNHDATGTQWPQALAVTISPHNEPAGEMPGTCEMVREADSIVMLTQACIFSPSVPPGRSEDVCQAGRKASKAHPAKIAAAMGPEIPQAGGGT